MAIPENAPQWLKDAKTKDADVVIELRFGVEVVIWRGGEFLGGEFLGGEFQGGYFRGGYFRGGEFQGEKLTRAPLVVLGLTWRVFITPKQIQIGCECHNAVEWFKFDDKTISVMEPRALKFWKENKSFIRILWKSHCKQ